MMRPLPPHWTLRAAWTAVLALALPGCDQPVDPAGGPLADRELRISPAGAALAGVGATTELTLVDSAGAQVRPDSVIWFSLAPAIASLDSLTGEVRAASAGQAIVGARIDTVALGYAVITVSVPGDPVVDWAADTLVRPPLRSVWGTGDGDVFVADRDRYVYHFDGTAWRQADPERAPGRITDLSGVAGGPLFAVGYTPRIHQYDGEEWTDTGPDQVFLSVWAATPTTAFAVSDDGGIWRYDGVGWTATGEGIQSGESALWGSGEDDVFAGGRAGLLLHFDGTAWTSMATGTDAAIRVIWGSGPDDVYAGGPFGVIHYDGDAWTGVDVGVSSADAIAGTSASDVWVARGSRLSHFDGTGWSSELVPTDSVADLWASPSGTVYAPGDLGAVAIHGVDGWAVDRVGVVPSPIRGLWTATPGTAFAVGADMILRSTPEGWRSVCGGVIDSPVAVWGVSDHEVLVPRHNGGIAMANDQVCSEQVVSGGNYRLTGVWAAAPDDAWVVGAPTVNLHPAVLYRYDGLSWRPTSAGLAGGPHLLGVWGMARDRIWAVGEENGEGRIWLYDGATWGARAVPAGGPIQAVWGTSAADVFAVGDGGRILHFGGSEWQEMDSPAAAALYAVGGAAPTDVYAVGDDIVLHYDGTAWTVIAGAPAAHYRSVWVPSTGPVYFGADGRIITGRR